ncbi:MAG: hypothetical protein ACLR4Z_08340 [Butyricicoccaceae bacterium]
MIYDNSELRHYYVVADASMVGSIHTRIKDHMIAEDNEFYADTEPQTVVDRAVKNEGVLIVMFWVFWIALTCGAVYRFLRAGKQVAGRIMYSPEMREYLKEIKRALVSAWNRRVDV